MSGIINRRSSIDFAFYPAVFNFFDDNTVFLNSCFKEAKRNPEEDKEFPLCFQNSFKFEDRVSEDINAYDIVGEFYLDERQNDSSSSRRKNSDASAVGDDLIEQFLDCK